MPPPAQPGGYGGGGGFQPPPAQPYGGGGVPPLEVGAAISYGWNKFQQYAKEFILLMLAAFAVIVVLSILSQLVLLPALNGDNTSFIISMVAFAVVFLIQFVVGFIVQAGIYRAGLAATRGGAPSFSMFTDTTNFAPYVLTIIVVGLLTAVGYVLCILPGLVVLVFTAYAPLLSLDKGMGVGDAIRTSIDMVRNNLGPVLGILIVSYLVYLVGALLCGIGLLVSAPVALVAICYSYRSLMQEPVAP